MPTEGRLLSIAFAEASLPSSVCDDRTKTAVTKQGQPDEAARRRVRTRGRARVLRKPRENLVVFREASCLGLGEDQLPVRNDIKDPAAAADEFALDAGLVADRGRQTGGLREIVSLSAVGDADLHEFAPRSVARRL